MAHFAINVHNAPGLDCNVSKLTETLYENCTFKYCRLNAF